MTFRHRRQCTAFHFDDRKGTAMHIPEHLRAPAIVFGLQFALLAGCGLVFVLLAQR
jgi:hypothetical protein